MRKYASAAILTTLVGAGLGFGVSPAFAADDVSCEGAIGATTVKSVVRPRGRRLLAERHRRAR